MKFVFVSLLIFVCLVSTARSQTRQLEALKRYQKSVEADKLAPLQGVRDPKRSDCLDIIDRARANATKLKTKRELLDDEMAQLLQSDDGRMAGTDDAVLKVLLSFELDSLEFTDRALKDRVRRLEQARIPMERGKGAITPADKQIMTILLNDAAWIEERTAKVDARYRFILNLKGRHGDEDVSSLPTLSDVLDDRRNQVTKLIATARFEGFKEATKEAEGRARKQAFSNQQEKTQLQEKRQADLHNLALQFIEAEYQIERSEIIDRIENTKDLRIRNYLTSSRVRKLLGPFCGSGTTLPRSHRNIVVKYDDDLIEPGPMSLDDIMKVTSGGKVGFQITGLVQVGNDPSNNRPIAWTVGSRPEDWRNASKTFRNIDAKLVNPYSEAFKIIREHGSKLVELGMLRQ